ncbi:MAG: iron uptake porin [Cyanobium sp. LacPavin_0920_WC12_MAG_62_9]|nr:iron uptake porin [Cyanobium sp. LacPavin_0920_WC12_MAG_62_9]
MNLSKKLVLALAGTGLVAPMAASAQEIAAVNGRAAVNEYMQQQDVDTFKAWASRNQVTSVNQFSDVKPTDWAYQALSNLVEKYGCVAGYPDGKFKGAQAMTRFEAAALLNACLDRVTEKTDELQKLLDEFDKELTILTARVDGLESKVGKLQAQQFSTTTKLKGEASMILGGIPGYTSYTTSGNGRNPGANSRQNEKRQGNTTFNYDIRLNFDTSYTGQDLLRTRLRSGNFSALPFGSSSQPFKLDKAESYGDAVYIDRLYYTFPVGADKSIKLTLGALVRNTEMVWLPTAYKSDVLDAFTTVGTSGTYNKATGQGVGFQWKQKVEKGKGAFIVNTNYVVSGNNCGTTATTAANTSCANKNGGSGSDSAYGVFDKLSGLNWLTQVGYAAPNWGAAVAYRYGTTGTAMRDGNGLAAASLLQGQSSSSIAFNAYWQPLKTGWFPSISAGYGYNFVSGNNQGLSAVDAAATGPASSASWFAGFQWDNAFIKGNAAGIAFGQPSFSQSQAQSDPWLVEWFYRFQVSDNISVTPTLFYGSGISTTRSGSGGGSGQAGNGTTFSGLGGVIQTTFKF